MIRLAKRASLAAAALLVLAGSSARADDFPDSVSGATSSAAATKSSNKDGVGAVVTTDGAIIYAAPDFDSAVVSQLPKGQKVRVSKGTAGDQARFHKVRIGAKIGYVADIDVSVEGSTATASKRDARSGKKKSRKTAKAREDKNGKDAPDPNLNPIYFTRFVGLFVGFMEFKESISGVDAATSFPYYGLKVTGPDVLIKGPVLDFNLGLHYGAPTYYEPLSSQRPIGFVLLTDVMLMLPFFNRQDTMAYLEAGPLLVWSKFSLFNDGRLQELSALNLGGTIALGAAHRIGKIGLRLEAKYFVEKQQYKAVQFALQTGF